ncbi:MAG: hypothetical protein Q4B43_03775 [Bacteroidota bacterium]|nr:hypothetical protein [Bacteroidota bacterium]
MINRWIHFWILPCSEISLLIEKKAANNISLLEKFRLKAHLNICKICSAYQKKAALMDKLWKNQAERSQKDDFKNTEIQYFKEKMKEKFKK